MERAIGVALLWVIAFAPGLFFIALFRALQPVLKGRRNEIISIMSRGETAQKYLRTFGASTSPGFEPTLDELFFSSFGRSKYYFPLTVLVTVAVLSMVTVFTRVGFDMGVPDFISAKIRMLGIEVIAGLGGAFVWGVYDGLRRFETIDLSPTDLHYIALRMIVSPLLAPIITIAFTDTLRPLVAFGIGAFPLNTLANFIKGQARTRLNLTGLSEPAEPPTLYHLQGVTPAMLDRLQDNGFESVEHLAGADPIKMLLKTNIEWKVILDLIDQAILFQWVGDKIADLRSLGVRGAIELATLQQGLNTDQDKERANALSVVASVAKVLQREDAAVSNMVQNAFEDVQVNLIWSFWGDASVADSQTQEDRGKGVGASAP